MKLRKPVIRVGVALVGLLCLVQYSRGAGIPPEVNAVHEDIWKRFILKPQGLVLDYANLDGSVDLPTVEDCLEAKPNGLSWWTPIENGPFFTGLYMDGVLRRWKLTADEADRAKARELMEGLMLASSVGSTPGFIARGVLADKSSHYGIGSDDQTAPWFYGLWCYLRSGAASSEEKARIEAKMLEVAEALESQGWLMPCDPVGMLAPGQFRGGWSGREYRGATRLLFVTRAMYELTKDARWKKSYEQALKFQWPDGTSRLQLVEEGMPGEWKGHPSLSKGQLWIYVVSQAMVRELYEMEEDASVKKAYQNSLRVCADAVGPTVTSQLSTQWGSAPYRTDWRVMNELWKAQTTVEESVAVANEQIRFWKNRGREIEVQAVREPFCAAWIAALDPEGVPPTVRQAETLIGKIPWKEACSSSAIFAEGAWYLLKGAPERKEVARPVAGVSPNKKILDASAQRTSGQFTFEVIPPELQGKFVYTVPRGDSSKPGAGFSVTVAKAGTVWLLAMDKGEVNLGPGWSLTKLSVAWNSGMDAFNDKVYEKQVAAGEVVTVPEAATVNASGIYAIPHALVVGE